MVDIKILKIDECGRVTKARVEKVREGDTFSNPLNPHIGYVVNRGKLIRFER